jgi:hypothetical protein
VFRALDLATGETVWEMQAAGPIGTSPSYHDGLLYIGCDEAFNAGRLYAVRASTGEVVWEYETGAGIWASPACDGQKVYVGDRAGVFHAVDAETGRKLWTCSTGGMILKPASFSPDGSRIVVGSEDMHVYCFSPDGERLWRSAKLPGLSLRDQGATIWAGSVVVRTNPTDAFHTVLSRNGDVLQEIQRGIELNEEDEVLLDKWGDYMLKPTPRRRRAEIKGIIEYLKEHPYDRTFHWLDLATGKLKGIPPVFYTGGLHNPPTPPAFDPRTGTLYTPARTALTYYLRGVRRYSCLMALSPEDGMPRWYFPEERHNAKRMWYGVPLIGDETSAVSLMDNRLVVTHQGDVGAIHLEKEKVQRIWGGRDTYGGIFGYRVAGGWEQGRTARREGWLVSMPNEWHGPDRAIVSIGEDRLLWVVGSQVVCLGGPGAEATETGGDGFADPIRNRLPLSVYYAKKLGLLTVDDPPSPTVTGEQLRQLVLGAEAGRRPPRASGRLADDLRRRLDDEVLELVEQGPWAPLAIQLGISGSDIYFRRTGQTMQAVARAMEHLSPAAKAKAKAYLADRVRAGMPLTQPYWPGERGQRREPYDLGPQLREEALVTPSEPADVYDVYALVAAAEAVGNLSALRPHAERMRQVADEARTDPAAYKLDDLKSNAAMKLNETIAGLIAYARAMEALGESAEVDRTLKTLRPLVLLRARHEVDNRRLVRHDGHTLHAASIPRYRSLTPRTARIVAALAGEAMRRNVSDLVSGLPVWYQAYGERMIGGENYISPPHLARSVFLALADGLDVDRQRLARYIDQPWAKADLYYIEKLSAALAARPKP